MFVNVSCEKMKNRKAFKIFSLEISTSEKSKFFAQDLKNVKKKRSTLSMR